MDRSAAGNLHGFPAALTSFVGRARVVDKVAGQLARDRLVTVTGPGGAGKTRLAGEVARQVAGRFADGVWLAELATVRDPGQVAAAVAAVLGIRDVPSVAAADALAGRQLLLVLDNCEHVIGAAAELCGRLLLGADDVRVLATSREPLRIAGEARFGQMVRNEARLAWRQPSGIIVSIGISLGLLVIFGEVSAFRQGSAKLGGLSAFDVYIPILIAFAIGVIALAYLPGPLVSYREQGILRRLSTTPAPASWVLAAQLVVQACLMLISILLLLIVSIVFFGTSAPKNPGGLFLAVILAIVALFTIGLAIAAMARTSSAARGIMAAAFYPLMFFAGLYYPVQLLPGAFQAISHYSPLGAAVQAMQAAMNVGFPPAAPLLVLAAYALVFGYLAKRFFRWE